MENEIFAFSDTFRYLDPAGFEHLACVKATTWEGLQQLLEGARADLMAHDHKPLMSAGLKITNEPLPSANDTPRTVPARDGGNDIELPEDVHVFTVKEVFRDVAPNSDATHVKVVIMEQDYQYANGNYGIACFHPESVYPKWKSWTVNQRKAPAEGAEKVLVRDPKPGSKRAEVVEFRSELDF